MSVSNSSTKEVESKQKNGSKPDAWEGFICGAVAGFTCRMFVAPLDVLKIRFQVQSETAGAYGADGYRSMTDAVRRIVSSEGVRALWKGNVAALAMASSYTAIQFGTYSKLNNKPDTNIFAVGGISAAVATLTTYPLDLIRTRMAAEPSLYPTIGSTVHSVHSRFGLRGFYFGIVPTIVQIVPYMALNYSAYERGKQYVLTKRDKMSTVDGLVVGGISGTLAKLCTLPLDNVKKRMQIIGQFKGQGSGYNHIIDAMRNIYAKEGIAAFFRGAVPSLVKAAPSSAITFAAYETTRQYLRKRSDRNV